MLHNVINFHFPPSAKLFVHRCGRAARQGRIGYSFSLVEPEEIAYMMDIHLFLNKTVQSGYHEQGQILEGEEQDVVISNPESNNTTGGSNGPYTLVTMTPEMIHTGLIMQDALDSENEYVKTTIENDLLLMNQYRVCENAMKQYHRTRTEATPAGIKAARNLVKKGLITTIHPLIAGCDSSRCHAGVLEKAAYVRALQSFRPAQTVLESGIGTGSSNNQAKAANKLKKKREAALLQTMMGSSNSTKLNSTNTRDLQGVEVMHALRRVMVNSLDRNRSSNRKNNSIITGNTADPSTVTSISSSEYHGNTPEAEEENVAEADHSKMEADSTSYVTPTCIVNSTKPRVSIAEKRRARKYGLDSDAIQSNSKKSKLDNNNEQIATSSSTSLVYKDKYYIAYGTENEHATYSEQALQPQSYLRSSETQSANILEQSLLSKL